MKEKIIKKCKKLLLPSLDKKQLPMFVTDEVIKNVLLGLFIFCAGIVVSITFRLLWVFVLTILSILVYAFVFYFGWYLKFASNSVLWYEVEVIDLQLDKIKKAKKVAIMAYRYLRKVYKVKLLDDEISFEVVLKGDNSINVGDQIRIYTTKESIVEVKTGKYIINNVLHMEKL